MRKRHANKSKQIKVILISDDEEIPEGYLPVAGAFIAGSEMQACIPEKIAKENPELANQLADEAFLELQKMFPQLGEL
jgi:hypothetical protein